MGRGRGKGKKISASNHDDALEEEEKVPVQKRRGRPQKPVKEAFDDEEAGKVEEEEKDGDDAKSGIAMKEARSPVEAENGNKRKRSTQVKGRSSLTKEENGGETRSSIEELSKPNGFRHNGSRRKSKPRRAAEAGVDCK
ncbi:hypothetical protein SAY87_025587 [Trapa incisa]|uniref:Uncharacterized protein n=2 Tax=Trapa TaxID=22665 RepID=A0AAN7LYX9_TRANT|nr:hypothetical protein SAY87_025587 [Trapa incisa]KAK4788857.1 hypothetical protein SAY86_020176 [Trapa natans]